MNVKLVPRWQDILNTWMEDLGISNDDFLRIYERVLTKWGNILEVAMQGDRAALKKACSACDFCNRADTCEDCIVTMLTSKSCTQWFEVIRLRHVWVLKDQKEITTAIAQVVGALAYYYGHMKEAMSEEEICDT